MEIHTDIRFGQSIKVAVDRACNKLYLRENYDFTALRMNTEMRKSVRAKTSQERLNFRAPLNWLSLWC